MPANSADHCTHALLPFGVGAGESAATAPEGGCGVRAGAAAAALDGVGAASAVGSAAATEIDGAPTCTFLVSTGALSGAEAVSFNSVLVRSRYLPTMLAAWASSISAMTEDLPLAEDTTMNIKKYTVNLVFIRHGESMPVILCWSNVMLA